MISQANVGGRRLFTVMLRDVTERVRAEAERERLLAAERDARREAEQANKAKADFLAVMSHELRTPLNAIAGHAQLIGMGLHGAVTDAQSEALARIDRSQRHLLRLINDVLNYARLESGHVEYRLQAVALADAVADVLPMVEPQLAANGIGYELRVDPGETAWADREKLQQVLLNLFSNAVKFTPAGGMVTVDTAAGSGGDAAGDVVYLRVSDTGPGIPRDKLEQIFEPFVQVDVTSRTAYTRTAEGTGLGLAISRDLARGMGGDLRARSVVGRGSTFTLTLRRSATDAGEPTDRRSHPERREGERRSGTDRRDDGGTRG
jgi:signal transduction histidine kinase